MKNIMFVILFLPFICLGQKMSYPKPFEFQLVDTASGSKSELYIRASEWVVNTFNSAKSVIQMTDKESGKIIAKGVMESDGKAGIGRAIYYIKYTISIDLKDNRYKARVYDFIVEGYKGASTFGYNGYQNINYPLDTEDPPSNGITTYPRKTWEGIKYTCAYNSKTMIDNLSNAMKSKSENW